MGQIESGDTILLSDGGHTLTRTQIENDVQLKGVGVGAFERCLINIGVGDEFYGNNKNSIDIRGKVSMANIVFDTARTSLDLADNSTLWMTNCAFWANCCGIVAGKGCRVDLKRVQFVVDPDSNNWSHSPAVISAAQNSSITAVDCLFDGVGGECDLAPCIEIPSSEGNTVELCLVNNKFRDMLSVPIGSTADRYKLMNARVNDGAVFEGNTREPKGADFVESFVCRSQWRQRQHPRWAGRCELWDIDHTLFIDDSFIEDTAQDAQERTDPN